MCIICLKDTKIMSVHLETTVITDSSCEDVEHFFGSCNGQNYMTQVVSQ